MSAPPGSACPACGAAGGAVAAHPCLTSPERATSRLVIDDDEHAHIEQLAEFIGEPVESPGESVWVPGTVGVDQIALGMRLWVT